MAFRKIARVALAFGVSLALAACGPKAAPVDSTKPWTAHIKELRIGSSGSETDPARLASMKAYEDYLSKALGIPVKVYNSSDYNGVAQAMAAGQIDVAEVGPSNYANMWLDLGDKVKPILTDRESDGSLGYYSVMIVRADSPYKTLDDLRGKVLAFADVNSASGYLLPTAMLRKQGKDPKTFFSKTIFAGGHEQAVIAVLQKQVDAGVTWTSGVGDETKGFSRGKLTSMVNSGMLNMKDIRIIWKGGPIPNGPIVIRSDLPPDLVEAFVVAHEKLPQYRPDVYKTMFDGDGQGFARVDHSFYKDIIEMRRAEDAARRAQ